MYLHDWAEKNWSGEEGQEAMLSDFNAPEGALDGAEVLIASYTYKDYSGSAFVLFERDGKLYEVHGSHCSCMGLENQWEPEETTKEAILHRLDKGTWGEEDKIADHVRAVLNKETN